jgi:hypothetical protein
MGTVSVWAASRYSRGGTPRESTVKTKKKKARLRLADRGDPAIRVRLSPALTLVVDQRATDQAISRSEAISSAPQGWFMSLGKVPIDHNRYVALPRRSAATCTCLRQDSSVLLAPIYD